MARKQVAPKKSSPKKVSASASPTPVATKSTTKPVAPKKASVKKSSPKASPKASPKKSSPEASPKKSSPKASPKTTKKSLEVLPKTPPLSHDQLVRRINTFYNLAIRYIGYSASQPHVKELTALNKKKNSLTTDQFTPELLAEYEAMARKVTTAKDVGYGYCSDGRQELQKARLLLGEKVRVEINFCLNHTIQVEIDNPEAISRDYFTVTIHDKKGNIVGKDLAISARIVT